MLRPPLIKAEHAWWIGTLALILSLAFAPSLPAATVITGDVTPALPWSASTSPDIGNTGAGTLAVDGGSQLSSGVARLGLDQGSSGTATITGAGSKWTTSSLYVGSFGSGSLQVEGGAQVSSVAVGGVVLGTYAGSMGTATITGAESEWTTNGPVYVGNYGSAELHVTAGGLVSSYAGSIGAGAGSTGAATITGSGSGWHMGRELYVGRDGNGALTVEDGGRVTAGTLYASLGDLHGDGTIWAGVGAVLDADLEFNATRPSQNIFQFGAGGTLTVKAAGGSLGAGYKGLGSLTIADGVAVSSASGYLGYHSGSNGTATISGAGSRWTIASVLYVGRDGSGALTVSDGAHVAAATLYASLNDLHGNGTIEVTKGAVLDADLEFNAAHPTQAILGFGAGGTLTVTAAREVLGAGYNGLGSLTVSEGAAVNSYDGYLGYNSGSAGTATITGAGSKWTNGSTLYIGNSGNGSLRVEAGAQVSSQNGYVGRLAGSIGMATITGAGSTWSNWSTFYVGDLGTGELRVESGGQLGGGGILAAKIGSTGTVTIAGPGSRWTSNSTLRIGFAGDGFLRVMEAGQVTSRSAFVGDGTGATGTATITGAGSEWTNTDDLWVGRLGSGSIRVEAGGQVSNDTGYLGHLSGSMGTAAITGAGSKWTNSSTLYVGNSGSGMLHVQASGQVNNVSGHLGYSAGSTGKATITGAGSKWANSSALFVGRNGSGELTITAGGLVSARGTLTIDFNGGNDSFVNMATGGMLALWGDADDSLAQFLGIVAGSDAIRYWNAGLANWTPLTAATLGGDYTLQYQDAGDLTGYTLLTVLAPGPPGDFDFDGRVNGADFLAWQRGASPMPNSPADLATWRANFGLGATTPVATPVTTAIPEPGTFALVGLALASLLLGCRSTR